MQSIQLNLKKLFFILADMTKKNLLLWSFLIFNLCFVLQAQKATPPLEIPLLLSGNFGEFRGSHFHSGLDIKTRGSQGFKVKSILSGSIRRIKVSTSGYGKTVYIEHTDGTTSVYAHLQKFAPKIEKIVKKKQYQKQRFLIQSYHKSNELVVKQGEVIGYSGNTGGSLGPHLHFELRDSKSQMPQNPLTLDFDIQDTQRPVVRNMYCYSLGDFLQKKKQEIPLVRKNDSLYSTDLQNWSGKKGIGIRMYDRQDLSYNKNGIYQIKVLLNGKEAIKYSFDSISFDDGKLISTLIDYATYKTEGFRIQKLFRDLPHGMSFLPLEAPDGIMDFEENRSYQLQIILEDFHGNKTYIESYINGIKATTGILDKNKELSSVKPELDYLFEFDEMSVYLPKNTFYETVNFPIRATKDSLFIPSEENAVFKAFEIEFDAPTVDSKKINPWCIALVNKKGELNYSFTKLEDGKLKTKVKSPGTYVLTRDTQGPTITPQNFMPKQWISNYSYLKIKIDDDFSGIKKYRATINDQWILLEYEPKRKMLTYNFEDIDFKNFKLNFKIEVEDHQGNVSNYETVVFRKPDRTKT
tara:strand:+ start:717 stop:2456 length:1740 start_codon:yes stop_codon:yes gene_type:complete